MTYLTVNVKYDSKKDTKNISLGQDAITEFFGTNCGNVTNITATSEGYTITFDTIESFCLCLLLDGIFLEGNVINISTLSPDDVINKVEDFHQLPLKKALPLVLSLKEHGNYFKNDDFSRYIMEKAENFDRLTTLKEKLAFVLSSSNNNQMNNNKKNKNMNNKNNNNNLETSLPSIQEEVLNSSPQSSCVHSQHKNLSTQPHHQNNKSYFHKLSIYGTTTGFCVIGGILGGVAGSMVTGGIGGLFGVLAGASAFGLTGNYLGKKFLRRHFRNNNIIHSETNSENLATMAATRSGETRTVDGGNLNRNYETLITIPNTYQDHEPMSGSSEEEQDDDEEEEEGININTKGVVDEAQQVATDNKLE